MRYVELRFPSISAVLHCRIVCKPAIVVLFLYGSSQYESLPEYGMDWISPLDS